MLKTYLVVHLALVACAPGANLAPPPDARAKIDKIFARYNRTDSPGCVIGATIDGGTVLSGAYGTADLEHGIALAPESILEPGSIAKQFADPVRKYIPEVPDYGTPITIRHLINHTSGLRDWGRVTELSVGEQRIWDMRF